ncbi:MAG: LemA family protein [Sphingopyxis sp.]
MPFWPARPQQKGLPVSNRRLAFALLAPVAAVSLAGCGINSVPTQEEAAKAKWADVQSNFQRRANLVGNLVSTVQAAASSERTILTEVANARAGAGQVSLTPEQLNDPAAMARYQQAQGQVTVALGRLVALQETYPQLRSQEGFLNLQSQLESTENRIQISIRDYNEAVRKYNTTIRTFPDAIGARIVHGAQPMTPYQAATQGAEVAPTVNFGQ